MIQQDSPVQINQWLFSYTEKTPYKARQIQHIEDSIEIIELNDNANQVLTLLIEAYPSVISAEELLHRMGNDITRIHSIKRLLNYVVYLTITRTIQNIFKLFHGKAINGVLSR